MQQCQNRSEQWHAVAQARSAVDGIDHPRKFCGFVLLGEFLANDSVSGKFLLKALAQ